MTDDLTLEQRVGAELHELAEAIAAHGIRAKNDACARTAFTVIALVRASVADEIAAAWHTYANTDDSSPSLSYSEGYLDGMEAAEHIARGDNSGDVKGADG